MMVADLSRQEIVDAVREVLIQTLALPPQARDMSEATPLFGALPELDSMGVVLVLTALEDRFDLVLNDDDIDAQWFDTLGSLADAIQERLSR